MADYSQYKNLELPKSNEHYDIAVANKNNRVIDSELHKLDLKNQSQDELLATKESLNSEILRATAKENEIIQNLDVESIRAKNAENNIQENLSEHIANFNNVDNTADIDKPVSTAQQDAIDLAVSTHNTSSASHDDIRIMIYELTTRLNALADSDDETLDQLSEIVSYIKSNKDLIDVIITNKVSVSDIIDNLISTATDKPLSANQGKILNELISSINTKVTTSYATLKKSVSDGKELVADAITEKGVETAADATFATMAENIGQIEIGPDGEINLQEKFIAPKTIIQEITPDEEYDGLSKVTVQPMKLEPLNVESFVATDPEEIKVYTNIKQDGFSNVQLSGVLVQSKTVEPTDEEQVITPDEGYGALSSVIVSAQQSSNSEPESVTIVGTITATIKKTVTASGTQSGKTNFTKTISLPFSGSVSLGNASSNILSVEYDTTKFQALASAIITGISFDYVSSVSMIAEHMSVDLETAQQMYDAKDVMFELEEDELETDKIQKILNTIAMNEKSVSQSEKLAVEQLKETSGVLDATISDLE